MHITSETGEGKGRHYSNRLIDSSLATVSPHERGRSLAGHLLENGNNLIEIRPSSGVFVEADIEKTSH